MFAIRNILCLLVLVAVATTACNSKKKAARRERARILRTTAVDDFATVLTLQKGDTYDKAVELLGEPSKIETNEGTKYNFGIVYYEGEYYERLVNFTYDRRDQTINHIHITGSKQAEYKTTHEFLKQQNIEDVKVHYLGMHRDSIIKIFGEPKRPSSGHLEYEDKGITVTFFCYEYQNIHCTDIEVFWNYHYKPGNN